MLEHRLSGSVETLAGRALNPWWFGFKGSLRRADANTWITKGIYTMNESNHTVTIEELPVGMWTKTYKVFLDKLLTQEGGNAFGFKNFDDLYDDVKVKFVLYFTEEGFDEAQEKPELFEKNFKLTSSWTTTNMHCFDADFAIRKFDCIE